MSLPTGMGNDDQLDTSRRLSGRTWVVIFFIAALFIDFAAAKTVNALSFGSSDDTLGCVLAGSLAAQFAGAVVVAGLAGFTWIRGQVFGISAACLIYLVVTSGTRFTQVYGAIDYLAWSVIGLIPWLTFTSSFPLIILRLLGWRLVDQKSGVALGQRPGIVDLFFFTAMAAATLTIARLEQVVMETESSDFWKELAILTALCTVCSAVFLPAALFCLIGSVHWMTKIIGMLVLAVTAYAGLMAMCYGVILFEEGFDGDWPDGMLIATRVAVSVSVFLGVVYSVASVLGICGLKLLRSKDSRATETVRTVQSISRSGLRSWVVTYGEVSVFVALAVGVNIYAARVEAWRHTCDQEIERLRRLVETVNGSLFVGDRTVFGMQMLEGATDDHIQEFGRHKSLTIAHIESSKITDRSLEILSQSVELEDLALPNAGITDAGLRSLAPLHELERLDFSGTSISGEGLDALDAFSPIVYLNLNGTRFSDAQIPIIDRFARLSYLSLNDTLVTDDGLLQLVRAAQIGAINLERTSICGTGFRRFSQVHTINVAGCERITDESLKNIAELATLRILSLKQTAVTDAGLKHLRRLKLHTLVLSSTSITDDGVATLPTSWLTDIDLSETKVTGQVFANWKPEFLRRLSLRDTLVDDQVLSALGKMELAWLELEGTSVTAQGIMSAGLKDCVIEVEPGKFSPEETRQLEACGIQVLTSEPNQDPVAQ